MKKNKGTKETQKVKEELSQALLRKTAVASMSISKHKDYKGLGSRRICNNAISNSCDNDAAKGRDGFCDDCYEDSK